MKLLERAQRVLSGLVFYQVGRLILDGELSVQIIPLSRTREQRGRGRNERGPGLRATWCAARESMLTISTPQYPIS